MAEQPNVWVAPGSNSKVAWILLGLTVAGLVTLAFLWQRERALRREEQAAKKQQKEAAASSESYQQPKSKSQVRQDVPATIGAGIPEPWAGFRGLKWGMSINDAPDMIFVDGSPALKFKHYRRKNDPLFFGEAELKEITYRFCKDHLDAVSISVNGRANWDRFRAAIFSAYGKGLAGGDESGEWWSWDERQHGIKGISMFLLYNRVPQEAIWELNCPRFSK